MFLFNNLGGLGGIDFPWFKPYIIYMKHKEKKNRKEKNNFFSISLSGDRTSKVNRELNGLNFNQKSQARLAQRDIEKENFLIASGDELRDTWAIKGHSVLTGIRVGNDSIIAPDANDTSGYTL